MAATNNSDDERNDFTSFPTLPDPEQQPGHLFGRLLLNTLRKVTNNALANYTRTQDESGLALAPETPSNLPSDDVILETSSLASEQHSVAVSVVPKIDTLKQGGLRLTNISGPTVQPSAPTTTVTTINPEMARPNTTTTNSSISPSGDVLQSTFTSIFNNLPNDIELSDDSGGSDTETINNLTSTIVNNSPGRFPKLLLQRIPSRNNLRAGQLGGHLSGPAALSMLPRRKPLPTVLLDNAKHIINTSVLLASSVMLEKRKKKPQKSLNNPLKSGGIPKFYWMNDQFVSECLNCFKPFTAFRRKHHCRFCGQIFCSDCTLFILYKQHKEERKGELTSLQMHNKSYSDKLRVCKPCYSDVIVYLSDDSSSLSSELEDEVNVNTSALSSSSNSGLILSKVRSDSSTREPLSRVISRSSIPDDLPRRLPATPEIKTHSYQRNHLLHMTIPTTRAGESVEIPLQHSELRSVNNLMINESPVFIKGYPSFMQSDLNQKTSFDTLYNRRKSLLVSLSHTQMATSLPTKAMSDGGRLDNHLPVADAESEHEEDEQAMSLYTLLNPYGGTTNQLSVPTLGEFPRMVGNDKRFARVTFGGINPHETSFLDDSGEKSNTRSNERAHASLLRIRQRRKSRSVRNPLPRTSSGGYISTVPISSSFLASSPTTPSLPTPRKDETMSPLPFDFPEDNIEEIFNEFLDGLLDQTLRDSDVKRQENWTVVLKELLMSVNTLKITDTLDIKQYIKIKKILGGKIEDLGIIDGLFITKNINLKKMLLKVKDPKIVLLMFPLEYFKQKEQFISLRIVHSQQLVYVTNLVLRLILLEPDVIVLGDSVSGLAEKLLEEAGITVISNVKPQVIERISRYTGGEIFQNVNDLFFKKGTLGTCGLFEVRKYRYRDHVKTFVFFTGGNIERGFTIALRGGDNDALDNVKYVTEVMIFSRLNDVFEKSFFEDCGLTFKDDWNEKQAHTINFVEVKMNNNQDDSEVAVALAASTIDHYISQFNERTISVSPAVKFTLPPVLSSVLQAYERLAQYYEKCKKVKIAKSLNEVGSFDLSVNIDTLPNAEQGMLKILNYIHEKQLHMYYIDYQSKLRAWTLVQNYTLYQLHPIFHRSLHVLSSTVLIRHQTPCLGPTIVAIDYYTDNDKCVGQFLDQIFADSSKDCVDCGDSLFEHYKLFSHGNGKIDMVLEKVEQHMFKNTRVMWSQCTECHASLTVTLMSDKTYFLSIGKFFELCFWGQGVIPRGECGHDFFRSHIRYVGYNDLAIKMVYLRIDTYEVAVPKKQVEYLTSIDVQLKVEAFTSVKAKSVAFFNSVNARLQRIKLDYSVEKSALGQDKIEQMKQKVKDQMSDYAEKTLQTYYSASPSFLLPLNRILRELQELGVIWENEFQEFGREYLPSENEITKLTQFHLKRFLENEREAEMDDKVKEKHKDEICDALAETPTQLLVDKLEGTLTLENEEDVKGIKSETNGDKKLSDVIEDEGEDVLEEDKEELNKNIEENIQKKLKELGMGLTFDNIAGVQSPPIKSPNDLIFNLSSDYQSHDHDSTIIDSAEQKTPLKSSRRNGSFSRDNVDSPTEEITTPIPLPNRRLSTVNAPLSKVMEKIHKMEAMIADFEESPKGSMKSNFSKSPMKRIPSLNHKELDASLSLKELAQLALAAGSSKVQHLASFFDQLHFDQISAEFKKQREQEMQKKLNKFRAFPVVASKPIVEIYDKIQDAVDVDERKDGEGVISEVKGENTDPEKVDSIGKDLKSKDGELPQPEKNSLLKLLSMFWADRSATLWDPLDYPLGPSEHAFADSDVIVREDEPSSLVAFSLSSTDYIQKIKKMAEEGDTTVGYGLEVSNKKAQNFAKIEKKFKQTNTTEPNDIEIRMNKKSTTHLKYQYQDGQTILLCKIFYSEQFEAFREACGNKETFIQSLLRCVKWDLRGGKSGLSFLKTLDDRYILKELSKLELELFVAIAPFYFKYMRQVMFHTLSTSIAKIFGFYQIHVKNPTTGVNTRMDFLVLENLFYNTKTSRIFDLKGLMRNRHVQQTGKDDEVLLDENMVEYIYELPVFVREQQKKLLRGSLFNDTAFLLAMDVMDYLLVIGFVEDGDQKLLCVGIIDCIRTFTWDKKVENWVKGTNLMGKKGKDPTIVTPKQYRIRFREAMERYILEVPDCWYEGK